MQMTVNRPRWSLRVTSGSSDPDTNLQQRLFYLRSLPRAPQIKEDGEMGKYDGLTYIDMFTGDFHKKMKKARKDNVFGLFSNRTKGK